jgi:hypothetical protein
MDYWMGVQNNDIPDPNSEYLKHYNSIINHLPKSVVEYINEFNFHDSNLIHFEFNQSDKIVKIKLFNRFKDKGFHVYAIEISDVESVILKSDPDKSLGGPGGFGDLGYSEFDYQDNVMIYSVLFSTGIEIDIKFKGDIKVKQSAQQGDAPEPASPAR